MTTPGEAMHEQREMMGLTKKSLADQMGIASVYLGELERGEKQPSFTMALKIERFLGIKVETWGFDRQTGERTLCTS